MASLEEENNLSDEVPVLEIGSKQVNRIRKEEEQTPLLPEGCCGPDVSEDLPSPTEVEDEDQREYIEEERAHSKMTSAEKAELSAADSKKAWWPAVFTTMPLFMGYSGMIVLQAFIKTRLGITEQEKHKADVFGVGVSFLYLGNLIFRLMHNVLFTCLRPSQRVLLAYFCMTCAHTLLAVMYYMVNSQDVVWVFVAYMISGVAIGSFESNLISCLTPLGHNTKMRAVVGIPLGFNLISIGSFILFAIFPEDIHLQMALYLFIAAANLGGLLFYFFVVPHVPFEASKDTVVIFFNDIGRFKEWLPIIWKHCVALLIDMFAVSMFSSISLYIYDFEDVPLWPYSSTTIPKNAFRSIYYTLSFLGDFTSRRVAYYGRARNPFIFWVLTVVGAGLIFSKTAILAPVGMFLVMFANGSIYAHTTRYVDNCVPKKFNLVALSVWLFVGDVGSFAAGSLVQVIQGEIGPVPTLHAITSAPTHSPAGHNSTGFLW